MFNELTRAYRYWHATGDRTAWVCDDIDCGCRRMTKDCVKVVESVHREPMIERRGAGETIYTYPVSF